MKVRDLELYHRYYSKELETFMVLRKFGSTLTIIRAGKWITSYGIGVIDFDFVEDKQEDKQLEEEAVEVIFTRVLI